MKSGLAAQTSGIFSDKQAVETPSSDVISSEGEASPIVKMQNSSSVQSLPAEEEDASRAKTPVLNTGKSSGQSSVVNASPQMTVKNKSDEPKRMPWDQQSVDKEITEPIQTSAEATTKATTKAPLPWQQQSSMKEEVAADKDIETKDQEIEKPLWAQQASTQPSTSASPKENSNNSQTASSETKIRRVIIDPVTGLYVETGLNDTNYPASENNNMSFDIRQEDLLEWPFWEMDGRIGLTVAKDSYNGSVAWEQNGESIDFRFRGPLGFGGLRIHGDLDDKVRVKTTTGQDFTVSDFESEMQERMGWSIPINSLRFWALGIVDPEVDADVVLNENDLLDELVQGDWKVVYEAYKEVDGVQLPRKFKITGPDTKIKMVVNNWTIPDSE